jgi:hypothetical protein
MSTKVDTLELPTLRDATLDCLNEAWKNAEVAGDATALALCGVGFAVLMGAATARADSNLVSSRLGDVGMAIGGLSAVLAAAAQRRK